MVPGERPRQGPAELPAGPAAVVLPVAGVAWVALPGVLLTVDAAVEATVRALPATFDAVGLPCEAVLLTLEGMLPAGRPSLLTTFGTVEAIAETAVGLVFVGAGTFTTTGTVCVGTFVGAGTFTTTGTVCVGTFVGVGTVTATGRVGVGTVTATGAVGVVTLPVPLLVGVVVTGCVGVTVLPSGRVVSEPERETGAGGRPVVL